MVGRIITAEVHEVEVNLLRLIIVRHCSDLIVISLLERGIRIGAYSCTMLGDMLDPCGVRHVHP